MPIPTTDDYLAALSRCGLLTPPQLAELGQWARAAAADPTALAREVSRRGWLTPFQLKEVYRGRGRDLAVGKYALLDLLGEGGMGRVYRARDTRLDRVIALKVIRKEKLSNETAVRRFHNEIRAVAQLSHPNVVLAFDAGEEGGSHFCAMELVEGTDLTKEVKARGPLPVPEACEYVRQAALGLHHAFERGLVHRDVKPSNLMVTKAGQVKVLDLGLAMLNDPAGGADENRLTQVGFVIGTPDFLAPEQAQNPQGVDSRADVYALGATLFFLLTGRVPYGGANATEKLIRHVSDPPPSLLAHRPDAPPQLDAVIRWMMAKRPEDRPQTPLHAAVALQPFRPGGGPPPGAAGYPAPPAGFAAPAVPGPDDGRNSVLFRLPASEAPARVRERDHGRGPGMAVAVWAAALVALGVAGYFLYELTIAPPPPPAAPPPTFTVEKPGLRMVRLDGGTFPMGSPDDEPGRGADEGPAGEVTVTGPFYMAATEVTNGQFAAVTGRTPAVLAVRAAAKVAAEMPVDSVTWDEAADFCRKLSDLDRGRRPGWAYRLPTEAEWEYACRAGAGTPFGTGDRLAPGRQAAFTPGAGDQLADGEQPRPPTLPQRVGQTEPNRFGLYDLSGNVWEWCQDWYAKGYPAGPRVNPAGPPDGDRRVVRGGAFDEPGARCRCAARKGLPPDQREPNVGFRVVFAPAQP